MNVVWKQEGKKDQTILIPEAIKDDSGSKFSTFSLGILRALIWERSSGRVSLIFHNPETTGPEIFGKLAWSGVELMVSCAPGRGNSYEFGPAPTEGPSPQHESLLNMIGYNADKAPGFADEASYNYPDTWKSPDVAGSPRIAQGMPAELLRPCEAGRLQAQNWARQQVLRPFLYDYSKLPYGIQVLESGVNSPSVWKNPDNGHLEVARIATGWLAYGDPVSRWMCKKFGEMLLTRKLFREGDWSGEETRAIGYALEVCVILEMVLQDGQFFSAARRIVDGGPYSDQIIHLPNWSMGAGSHGYPSPQESMAYFNALGLDYDENWNVLEAGERLAKTVEALKAAAGGKHTFTIGPGGLFDFVGRSTVVWQLGILARGLALYYRADQYPMAHKLHRYVMWHMIWHGRGDGYSSEDAYISGAEGFHDAFMARWPMHKEPAKIAHGGTSLWYVPSLYFGLGLTQPGMAHEAKKALAHIMSAAKPSEREWVECCWPWKMLEGEP